MRKRSSAIFLLACAGLFLLLLAASPALPAKPAPPFQIRAIVANFYPSLFETQYAVLVHNPEGMRDALTASFKITLELVDKAGAPNPGTPGSGAAVDLGCTNAGVGIPHPEIANDELHGLFLFGWTHPDPADSDPPGKYHCNHMDMGPSGHQGLITIVVSDKKWHCTATYKGTNSSTNKSVAQGIASEPICRKITG